MKKISLFRFIKLLESQGFNVKKQEKFSNYTTFQIGGRIRGLVVVKDINSLMKLIKLVKNYNIKYFILGRGSNILCSDKIYEGIVIKIEIGGVVKRENRLICGAGVSLYKLNNIAKDYELSGLEWSFGVPGSVGGGVKMNAGCFGGEMGEVVEYVYYTDGIKIYKRTREKLEFSYRHSFFSNNDYVILKVCFSLKRDKKDLILSRCFNFLNKRRLSQPYDLPSAGSVFKKPKEGYAPVYIDACSLKGTTCGGAMISKKHSGFIVNFNKNAKFKDVFKLICKIKKTVFKKFGIMLDEEIIILR